MVTVDLRQCLVRFERVAVAFHTVQFREQVVEASNAPLALDDLFEALNVALHNFLILLGFRKTLFQCRNVVLYVAAVFANARQFLAQFRDDSSTLLFARRGAFHFGLQVTEIGLVVLLVVSGLLESRLELLLNSLKVSNVCLLLKQGALRASKRSTRRRKRSLQALDCLFVFQDDLLDGFGKAVGTLESLHGVASYSFT